MTDPEVTVAVAVEERTRFEALLADLSAQFVSIDDTALDAAIHAALEQLARSLDADRAALTRLSDDQQTLVFTHAWAADRAEAMTVNVDAARLYPVGLARILGGRLHSFASLDDLPTGSPDRQYLEARGTQSGVVAPLLVNGRVIGSLGFTCRRARQWNTELVQRLGIIAHVFASALAHRQTETALRHAIDDRLAFETLVGELASHFVNLDSDAIDATIEDAQRRIVETLGLDRSALLQFNSSGALIFTHYWSRPGSPSAVVTQGEEVTMFPWLRAQAGNGETVVINSVDDLPPDAPDREDLVRVGTKATVCVPLLVSGRAIGLLTFGALRAARTWSPETVNRLKLIGQVFAAALARRRSETKLRHVLQENVRLRHRLVRENVYLQREVKEQQGPSAIMGTSDAVQRLLGEVDQVAPTDATVLLLGETGTGKELIATAIHERSPRARRPMVRVNCAAIPLALIESELFGREKGAFTGALARQIGRFEVADGSTIFLDEVGELPPDVQVKLLRVLQERHIERLGSARSIKIDVRVVAATNRDLETLVADGRFREDLYYRVAVFPIRVPPLRERQDDIPTLTWAFIEEFSRALGKQIESISEEHLAALQQYAWPGNVRELRNAVERAVIVSKSPRLAIDLPRPKMSERGGSLRLDDVERAHIVAVLEKARWRVRGPAGAAEVLGLKPSTLEGRMARLSIRRPDPPAH